MMFIRFAFACGLVLFGGVNQEAWARQGGSVSSASTEVVASQPITEGDRLGAINVDEYGAKDDDYSDNTEILNKLFLFVSHNHPGSAIYFPCHNKNVYLAQGQIVFQPNLTYVGGYRRCSVWSNASGSSAFSFVGVDRLEIKDLDLKAINANAPPKAVAIFGRRVATEPAGHATFYSVQIDGFAREAVVYSIASEENRWFDPTFILNGGGAKYIYYTSDADDLNLCSCAKSSNTDDRFFGIHFSDLSPASNIRLQLHSIVRISGESSGDISFLAGYMSTPGDGGPEAYGSAFSFVPSGANTLQGSITIQSIRVENAQYFAKFEGTEIHNIQLLNNTMATAPGTPLYFSYADRSVAVRNLLSEGNSFLPSSVPITSSYGTLIESVVMDTWPTSVMSNKRSFVLRMGQLGMTLPSDTRKR